MASNASYFEAHQDFADRKVEGIPIAQHPLATQEWLASHILQKLGESTGDVLALCQLALINKNFCAASNSDLLWQKLLPPAAHLDFLFTDQCDDSDFLEFWRNAQSKKALYQRLCRPISIAERLQKFWLDRRTSGECYMMSARALTIIWGSSPQYWKWTCSRNAWFPEVAFLSAVCWFEIKGKFRQLLRPGSYIVSFRIQIRNTSSWSGSPIKLSLQNVTDAHESVKSCTSFFQGQFPSSVPPPPSLPPPPDESQLTDEDTVDTYTWIECDVGEFTVEENEDNPTEVEFSMREVEILYWKTGFLLDGVFIRPSCVVKALERYPISIGGYEANVDNDDESGVSDYGNEEEGYASMDNDKFVDGIGDDVDKLSDEEEAT